MTRVNPNESRLLYATSEMGRKPAVVRGPSLPPFGKCSHFRQRVAVEYAQRYKAHIFLIGEVICDILGAANFNLWRSNFSRFLMQKKRRTLVIAIAAAPLAGCQSILPLPNEQKPMYGLIGKIKTKPGHRDSLASILLRGTQGMPNPHKLGVS